jgi:hypothetical protein
VTEQPLDENAILTCCALRFDGYQYAQDHGFKPDEIVEQFLQTGEWDGSEPKLLAAFFFLQRALFKWSLVYEPENGHYWRAFRELFLRLYAAEIPEQYRMADYYEEWMERFYPQLAECVEAVRQCHENTIYEGNP